MNIPSGGRTALFQGYLIVITLNSMKAYRNKELFNNDLPSCEVGKEIDITLNIKEGDYGEFTPEIFNEVAGDSQYLGETDICVGCGQEFPVGMLLYEGVEPIVFAPRCNICTIKQVQDIAGAENVILPESWRN